jgi:hypothetical protein
VASAIALGPEVSCVAAGGVVKERAEREQRCGLWGRRVGQRGDRGEGERGLRDGGWRGLGRAGRRGGGGAGQAGEDGLPGEGVLDAGDEAQPAATPGTGEDIEPLPAGSLFSGTVEEGRLALVDESTGRPAQKSVR